MSSQAFLWLNLGFAVLMAVIFYLGRSKIKDPSRLRLKGSWADRHPTVRTQGRGLSPEAETASAPGEKNLNVIFMYNGHTWDAHEVLGIPAGCKLEVVKAAYAEALRKCSGESRSFIETAYRAILEKAG